MKAILLLGTSLVGAKYLDAALKKMGYKAIFLLNIEEYSGEPKRAIACSEYYSANVNSLEDIFRAIKENNLMDPKRLEPVVAITSLLDETLYNACMVAEYYGIQGPDPALKALTDKAKVHTLIPEFSPPSLILCSKQLSFWCSASEAGKGVYTEYMTEADAACNKTENSSAKSIHSSEFSHPIIDNKKIEHFLETQVTTKQLVLKPVISSGAVGIHLLDKKIMPSISALVNSIADHMRYFKADLWVLQPRLSGRLYSLEGYVKNSEVFFIGFAKRARKELTEIANEFPVDADLPITLRNQCKKIVETLIERSHYLNGYFHCEFLIDESSSTVYFIDSNAGRIAGDTFIERCALFHSIETEDILQHVIDLGVLKNLHKPNFHYSRSSLVGEAYRTFSLDYCLEKSDQVFDVTLPKEMKSFHTQLTDAGKTVPAAGSSDSAWVGFLAGWKKDVLTDIQLILINTPNGLVKPFYILDEESLE